MGAKELERLARRETAGFVITITILAMVILLGGCAGLYKSTEGKQVNLDFQVYGFRVIAYDPVTMTFSPSGEFGFGSTIYRSIPVEKGQPFFARHTVKSLWSADPASETIIWIGRAKEKGALDFEAVPEGMMVVSKNGIIMGPDATLKLTPATEPVK